MRQVFVAALTLGCAPLVAALPATAAVRSCKQPVAGAITQASTEPEAKRLALESWTAKVAVFGPGYTRWQLAVSRALVCRPGGPPSSRTFACIATAAPCTIQQAPGVTPGIPAPPAVPGPPKRRLIPTPGRNTPYEV